MKKVKTKRVPIGGVDFEYQIGEDVMIHSNIDKPEFWYISSGLLGIRKKLCSKVLSEKAVKIVAMETLVLYIGNLRGKLDLIARDLL